MISFFREAWPPPSACTTLTGYDETRLVQSLCSKTLLLHAPCQASNMCAQCKPAHAAG